MSEEQRLKPRIAECKQRWDRLSEKISLLNKDKDLATHSDEKFSLAEKIRIHESERLKVEIEWQDLEAEWKKRQANNLVQDARRMERNKAFKEAISAWETIRDLNPDAAPIESEIQRLADKQRQSQHLADCIKQLTRCLSEIRLIYPHVIARLRQINETGVEDEAALDVVNLFLQKEISAEEFITAWQALEADVSSIKIADEPNYCALSDRLRRGEIVLFLGSDIPRLLGANFPVLETVVPELARKANYEGFSGPLSEIAEYYQMKPEYGRSCLIRNLNALTPPISPVISLYGLLAQIEQPLVLISATYDMFLEEAFRKQKKKYALVSSIICNTMECEIGNILIRYSDNDTAESIYLEQDLSGLKLLDVGYSLIYKIRGYCDPKILQIDYQQNTLALAEENYFTFARHMEKLIPSYVVRQFVGRGLLFLGYAPRHWEDRLLVNAILDKRPRQYEPPYTISEDTDPFERAYWESRGVHKYTISLKEFVRKLEEYSI